MTFIINARFYMANQPHIQRQTLTEFEALFVYLWTHGVRFAHRPIGASWRDDFSDSPPLTELLVQKNAIRFPMELVNVSIEGWVLPPNAAPIYAGLDLEDTLSTFTEYAEYSLAPSEGYVATGYASYVRYLEIVHLLCEYLHPVYAFARQFHEDTEIAEYEAAILASLAQSRNPDLTPLPGKTMWEYHGPTLLGNEIVPSKSARVGLRQKHMEDGGILSIVPVELGRFELPLGYRAFNQSRYYVDEAEQTASGSNKRAEALLHAQFTLEQAQTIFMAVKKDYADSESVVASDGLARCTIALRRLERLSR